MILIKNILKALSHLQTFCKSCFNKFPKCSREHTDTIVLFREHIAKTKISGANILREKSHKHSHQVRELDTSNLFHSIHSGNSHENCLQM